jgi:hypothetical protein
MYSVDEINEALEKDKLSDVLYKMERFARAQGLTGLAQWCSWELYGYSSGYGEVSESAEASIIRYRTIPIQWRNIYGQPVIIDPTLAFMQRVPIWAGVSELEGFLKEGFGYSIPGLAEKLSEVSSVQLGSGHVAPDVIRGLLDRIRLQARARLHDEVPRDPARRVVSGAVPQSKEVSSRAYQLFEEVQTLTTQRSLDVETARLLIEKADDAIREFGNTNQEKKVQLRKWKDDAELVLPPQTIDDLRKRAEGQILKKSYPKSARTRNILLVLVGAGVILLGLWSLRNVIGVRRELRSQPNGAAKLPELVLEFINSGKTPITLQRRGDLVLWLPQGISDGVRSIPGKYEILPAGNDAQLQRSLITIPPSSSIKTSARLQNEVQLLPILEAGSTDLELILRREDGSIVFSGQIPFTKDSLQSTRWQIQVSINKTSENPASLAPH